MGSAPRERAESLTRTFASVSLHRDVDSSSFLVIATAGAVTLHQQGFRRWTKSEGSFSGKAAGPPFENSSRAITRTSGVFSASLHTRARNANTLNVITIIKLHRALLREDRGIFRACFTTKMEAWLDPIQPGSRIHP
jgi:hypothetical protein